MEQVRQVYKGPPYVEAVVIDPEIIHQIREFTRLGWGAERIGAELGVARNTVRRYRQLASEATVRQVRPGARFSPIISRVVPLVPSS